MKIKERGAFVGNSERREEVYFVMKRGCGHWRESAAIHFLNMVEFQSSRTKIDFLR